ncbi:MAG: L-serine ammonia-lyase [Clostridia bacterium]|nr:L-serine ammonia-lyase [Clostridia bacterium]
MESLCELYKIGRGPSSSHTIGPERAVRCFADRVPTAKRFAVRLFGSLAKTGVGHGTDTVIKKTLAPRPCEIIFDPAAEGLPHPNTMELIAFDDGGELCRARVLSVGGGSIVFEGESAARPPCVYPHSRFAEIAAYCRERDIRLWEYVAEHEGEEIFTYLDEVWSAMKSAIRAGLDDEGELPGGLGVQKKANTLYHSQHVDETPETRESRIVCAYAFAVSEQNAAGERIVTAPTCGAAGVLPAVLYYQQKKHRFSDREITEALATAGIIGNLIKTNASISGAECGCQAEIGSACAMAAAALAELFGFTLDKIEYAAEIAIEHHLGLTCDPICGLVQIPCIERNAVAAMRAINAVNLSGFLWNTRKISFDRVVDTMRETGLDMHTAYKETAEGGLAKIKIERKKKEN